MSSASGGVPFWEHSLEGGLRMLERAVQTHIIANHHAVPLLVRRGQGIIFEITDDKTYDYRREFFYDLAKVAAMRMARTMAIELRPHGVVSLAVTPGFLRSEAMLDHFGVTEDNWRDGASRDRFFALSETPRYIGRAIAALAGDPKIMDRSGETWDLAEEYGFTDVDGTRPHSQRSYDAEIARGEGNT